VIESKQLKLEKIYTDDNALDMMTKALPKDKITCCRKTAGVMELPI